MKPLAIAIQAALGTSVLLGCATTAVPVAEIKPVLTVRGAAEARDYYTLARHFHVQGRLTQAMEAYRKALALDPANTDAHNGLGTLFATAGDLDRAVEEFEAAIAADGRSALSYNNLGYARHLQGRDAEAVAAFETSVALDPSGAGTWNNLATSLSRTGDHARADAAYARARDAAVPAGTPAAARGTASRSPAPPRIEVATSPGVRSAEGSIRPSPTPLVPIVPAAAIVVADLETFAPADVAPRNDPGPMLVAIDAPPAVPVAVIERPSDDPVAAALLAPTTPIEPLQATPLQPLVDASMAIVELPAVHLVAPAEMAMAEAPTPAPTLVSVMPLMPAAAEAGARTRAATGVIRQAVLVPVDVATATTVADDASAMPAPQAVETVGVAVPSFDPAPVVVALAPPSATPPHPAPASAGTAIVEVPERIEAIVLDSAAVELRWAGTATIARPLTMADVTSMPAYRLEVSNGNGIAGLARKVAGLFAAIGVTKARLTNQKPFTQPASIVQYRDGHRAAALALSARVPGRPAVVPSTSLRADVDVRLVLGADTPRDVALLPIPDLQASGNDRSAAMTQ